MCELLFDFVIKNFHAKWLPLPTYSFSYKHTLKTTYLSIIVSMYMALCVTVLPLTIILDAQLFWKGYPSNLSISSQALFKVFSRTPPKWSFKYSLNVHWLLLELSVSKAFLFYLLMISVCISLCAQEGGHLIIPLVCGRNKTFGYSVVNTRSISPHLPNCSDLPWISAEWK